MFLILSYPLEMHMVHIEDKFIDRDGTVIVGAAEGDAHGLSILAVLFHVDNNKPQVCFNKEMQFSLIRIYIEYFF